MKSLLIALIVLSSTSTFAADKPQSEIKLKSCVSSVYSAAASSKLATKEVIKEVSSGVKECRKVISDLKKQESKAKKLANKAKRIEKLKAQLTKLTSN